MSNWETGLNITTVPVAGVPGNQWWILGFGTVFVINDKHTELYEHNSMEVGRARGAYVNLAVDGSDLHLLMSHVFTNQEFSGSTLEIQGSDWFYNKKKGSVRGVRHREIPAR